MPTLTATADAFSLTSTWRTTTEMRNGTPYFIYSEATYPRQAKVFDLSGIPKGSTVTEAKLAVKSANYGSTFAYKDTEYIKETRVDAYGDKSGSRAINVLPWFEGVTTFGNFAVGFQYNAYPNNSSGTSTMRYRDLSLTVTYTLPYSACAAPTQVTLNHTTATPSQQLKLTWSGAKAGTNVAITGYEVYRATTKSGAYTLLGSTGPKVLSLSVIAPAETGSYYYKVKTIGDRAGYDSALSSAVASVKMNVTAVSMPVGLALSQSAQHPNGTVTLSWQAAGNGTNNIVTGYAVYRANKKKGKYALYQQVAANSCTVTATQEDDILYFRVAALGQYVDSEMSEEIAVLDVDMSGTSDFIMEQNIVTAGTPLTVRILSNLDKQHTVMASIGNYAEALMVQPGVEALTITPPLLMLNAMPDSDTAPMEIRVSTQDGGAIIRTAYLRCPDDVVPTGVTGTASPSSSVVPSGWNVYVAGQSAAILRITQAAQAPYGAEIVRYAIDGPGIHIQDGELPMTATSSLLEKGDQVFTLTATDSRGRQGKSQITVTALAYSKPTLRGILSQRCDASGAEADEGLYARCTATVRFSACDGHNSAVCRVAYRRQGDSAWIDAGPLQDQPLLIGGSLALNDNWDIRYTISDTLGFSHVYYDVVTRAVWEMHVKRGGGAWAFGGVADLDGALHVYGDVRSNNIDDLAQRLTALEGKLLIGAVTPENAVTLPLRRGLVAVFRQGRSETPVLALKDHWGGLTYMVRQDTLAALTADADTVTITSAMNSSHLDYLAVGET
ncbi:MAG: hypothetical protein IJ662_09275 [Clostridia bacterium]|nr:hypothetical protein [Clostridia bacterium]